MDRFGTFFEQRFLVNRFQFQLKKIIEAETPSLKPGGGNPTSLDRSRIQMLLCGDLNSLPESGMISYNLQKMVQQNFPKK